MCKCPRAPMHIGTYSYSPCRKPTSKFKTPYILKTDICLFDFQLSLGLLELEARLEYSSKMLHKLDSTFVKNDSIFCVLKSTLPTIF